MSAEKIILLVDDSKLARSKISKILMDNYYAVHQAENAQMGLTELETLHPDIILLDLLMPVMDGFEFLSILHEKGNKIPIIVLTADIQQTSKKRCMEMGASAFLNKPPDNDELIHIIQSFIG